MKVVSYGHAYVGTGWAAGGETTLHDLLASLAKRGWDVEFILSEPARNGAGDQIIDGVKVRAFTDNQQPNRAIPTADVVVSHLGGAQRSSIIAKNCGVPSVHLIHNNHSYTVAMARHANFLVYNTDWILKEFQDNAYRRPPGIVVHPPVDPAKYQVRTSRKYITCVNLSDGSDGHYDKGSSTFYEMARRFPEERFLGVCGAYGHQDVRSGYDNVTFLDHTDDINAVYRKSKVVLSPSRYESYGRVVIEAACSGIPSISSTATGFLESKIPVFSEDFRAYDAWESSLRTVLADYKSYSSKSKSSAKALWQKSEHELDAFASEVEALAKHFRSFRRRT